MSLFRPNPAVSLALLIGVLLTTAARAPRLDSTRSQHVITRSSPANVSLCYLCDAPDCALPATVAAYTPPARRILPVWVPAEICDFSGLSPHHVRPPPVS
jgi:hypothetical protein